MASPKPVPAEAITQEDGDQLRAKALAADANQLPPGYYTSIRVVGSFVGIGITLIATYFVFEASAAAIVGINADIGPSANASLMSTVWTVAQPISILIFGRLSDRFGRRNFLLGANILGIVGAIVCCTAKTFNTLIGGMVLVGLASGPPGSYPLLTGELMSNRTKFLGTICVVIPNIVATGFGPYIGQRLNVYASWRWNFYIYIIVMAVGTVFVAVFYHPPSFIQMHGKHTTKREELLKVDWIGVFLLTAGLTLFLVGISWGGSPQPWDSPRILGLLISGAVACVAFVLFECFSGVERPIIPMRFFRDLRGFTCLTVISGVMGIMNIALFIMYPQQVTYIFGSTLSGWEETAWLSSTAAFGIYAGVLILGSLFHLGHIRWQLVAVSCWVTAFLGAMASVNRTTKTSAIVFSFFTALGVGWGEVVTMLLVQFSAADQDLGVAFAVVSAARTILGSIFTAAFVAVYTNKVPGELQTILVPRVLAAGLPQSSLADLLTAVATGSTAAIAAVPGMTSKLVTVTVDAVADSYAAAYAYVYYFAVALGCVSIIASACCADFDRYLNDHVPHQIYHRKDTTVDPLEGQASGSITESEKKTEEERTKELPPM